MKLLPLFLIAAAFAVQNASAQMGGGPPDKTGNGATDDAASSISTIHRSTPKTAPAAAAANPNGPKKPIEVSLSKDAKDKGPVTKFAAATPKIYLHYDAPSATKGEKLRVVWIAESAKGIATKNKKLTESAQTLPGPVMNGDFYLPAAASGFPVGSYRADVYEDAKLSKSLKFTVE